MFSEFMETIDGYKTYIGGAVVFFAGGAKALGWIDKNTFDVLATIGGAITVFGLRHAISKVLKK